MAEYRYVGAAPTEVAVGDARVPVGPGDFVDLDDSGVEDNKAMVDSGDLIAVEGFGQDTSDEASQPTATASKTATTTTTTKAPGATTEAKGGNA